MVSLEHVAEFRSCITCVYRRFYPPARASSANPIFYRFYCERAADSGKPIVRPEDACDFWRGATLGFEG